MKLRKTKRPVKLDMEWAAKMRASGAGFYGFTTGDFPIVANLREHWSARVRRCKHQRELGSLMAIGHGALHVGLPARVIITRYSLKLADSDNLPSAYKAFRDGIADAFKVDDGTKSLLQFEYRQVQTAKRGQRGTMIEIVKDQKGGA